MAFFLVSFRLLYLANKRKLFNVSGLAVWGITSMTHIVIELNLYRGFYNEYLYMLFGIGMIMYLNLKKINTSNGKKSFARRLHR